VPSAFDGTQDNGQALVGVVDLVRLIVKFLCPHSEASGFGTQAEAFDPESLQTDECGSCGRVPRHVAFAPFCTIHQCG